MQASNALNSQSQFELLREKITSETKEKKKVQKSNLAAAAATPHAQKKAPQAGTKRREGAPNATSASLGTSGKRSRGGRTGDVNGAGASGDENTPRGGGGPGDENASRGGDGPRGGGGGIRSGSSSNESNGGRAIGSHGDRGSSTPLSASSARRASDDDGSGDDDDDHHHVRTSGGMSMSHKRGGGGVGGGGGKAQKRRGGGGAAAAHADSSSDGGSNDDSDEGYDYEEEDEDYRYEEDDKQESADEDEDYEEEDDEVDHLEEDAEVAVATVLKYECNNLTPEQYAREIAIDIWASRAEDTEVWVDQLLRDASESGAYDHLMTTRCAGDAAGAMEHETLEKPGAGDDIPTKLSKARVAFGHLPGAVPHHIVPNCRHWW